MKCFILLEHIPYFASQKAGEIPEQQDWMGVSIVAVVTMKKLNKAENKTGEDEGMQLQCSTKGRQKEALMLFPFQCAKQDSSAHLNFAK